MYSVKTEIECLLNGINKKEKKVIVHYFGLSGEGKMSLSEVGKKLKITRERVRQLEKIAFNKLRDIWLKISLFRKEQFPLILDIKEMLEKNPSLSSDKIIENLLERYASYYVPETDEEEFINLFCQFCIDSKIKKKLIKEQIKEKIQKEKSEKQVIKNINKKIELILKTEGPLLITELADKLLSIIKRKYKNYRIKKFVNKTLIKFLIEYLHSIKGIQTDKQNLIYLKSWKISTLTLIKQILHKDGPLHIDRLTRNILSTFRKKYKIGVNKTLTKFVTECILYIKGIQINKQGIIYSKYGKSTIPLKKIHLVTSIKKNIQKEQLPEKGLQRSWDSIWDQLCQDV